MIQPLLPAVAVGAMFGLVALALLPQPDAEDGIFEGLLAELEAREALLAADAAQGRADQDRAD